MKWREGEININIMNYNPLSENYLNHVGPRLINKRVENLTCKTTKSMKNISTKGNPSSSQNMAS